MILYEPSKFVIAAPLYVAPDGPVSELLTLLKDGAVPVINILVPFTYMVLSVFAVNVPGPLAKLVDPKEIETCLLCPWFVSVMYQFPVSYPCEVENVIAYAPLEPAVVLLVYVNPDGLVKTALTEVYGCADPVTPIKFPTM